MLSLSIWLFFSNLPALVAGDCSTPIYFAAWCVSSSPYMTCNFSVLLLQFQSVGFTVALSAFYFSEVMSETFSSQSRSSSQFRTTLFSGLSGFSSLEISWRPMANFIVHKSDKRKKSNINNQAILSLLMVKCTNLLLISILKHMICPVPLIQNKWSCFHQFRSTQILPPLVPNLIFSTLVFVFFCFPISFFPLVLLQFSYSKWLLRAVHKSLLRSIILCASFKESERAWGLKLDAT